MLPASPGAGCRTSAGTHQVAGHRRMSEPSSVPLCCRRRMGWAAEQQTWRTRAARGETLVGGGTAPTLGGVVLAEVGFSFFFAALRSMSLHPPPSHSGSGLRRRR